MGQRRAKRLTRFCSRDSATYTLLTSLNGHTCAQYRLNWPSNLWSRWTSSSLWLASSLWPGDRRSDTLQLCRINAVLSYQLWQCLQNKSGLYSMCQGPLTLRWRVRVRDRRLKVVSPLFHLLTALVGLAHLEYKHLRSSTGRALKWANACTWLSNADQCSVRSECAGRSLA